MLKQILFSAAFMVALFGFAPGVHAASAPFTSVSSSATTTDRGQEADHTVTFTTSEAISSGEDFYFLYLANQVDPSTTGIDFTGLTFSETEEDLNATFTLPGPTYIALVTLNEDLPAGTYSFTIEGLTNPDADLTIYASITDDDNIGQNSEYTQDSDGLVFGEGTVDNGNGGEENDGDNEGGDEAGGNQECTEQAVPELENVEAFSFGEYVYLSWDESEDAASYVVSYSLEESLVDPVTVEAGVEDLEYIVGPLDSASEYYMVVRADDANNCNVGVGSHYVMTQPKTLENQRMPKAEFKMPKSKRKKLKFNIKPELGEELAVVQRLEYQVFKGKKIKKADRIGKKIRKQKNKNLGNAITVKGKNVEAGTYYWVRVRKVYKIGDEVIKTKYSKKKRLKTAGEKVVTGM